MTRTASTIFSDIKFTDPSLSDHYAVLSSLAVPYYSRSPRITKLIRNIKKINTSLFSSDILSSALFSSPAPTLSGYLLQFSSILSNLLDKHAPLRTITCPSRPRKPFITADILTAKAVRSKLESIYRKRKSSTNFENFKKQETIVAKLVTASRRSYYRNLISQCRSQPKKLWSALDSLLSRKIPPCLPTCSSPSELASTFLNFFNDKIAKLFSSLIVAGY